MIELGIVEGILLVPLCFGLAFLLIRAGDKIGRASTASNHQPSVSETQRAVFLFESGVLRDANAFGQSLLLVPGENKSDWGFLANILAQRFPGFPLAQGTENDNETRTFTARDNSDKDFVLLEQWDSMARVTLQRAVNFSPSEPQIEPTPTSMRVLAEAPYPVWQSNVDGQVEWANDAYFKLAEQLEIAYSSSTIPVIFEQPKLVRDDTPVRTAVLDPPHSRSYWFDVTTAQSDGLLSHFATDANAIVNAEVAQRNFVQTLTKTFAQLSIGLVIFDRNRQLALFNPALIDLTALPADFLSSRPNLLTFFDRLREKRMIPEPRNYSSWREQIAELVVAASDDRYAETWTLPSGVTYRVMGRPHPDGAIAFLFEDISAEVSLTRRFRADMELGKSTFDSLNEAIVVFAATGKLNFCNLAYRTLWNSEPENGITEYSFQDGMRQWRLQTEKTDIWERLRHHILDLNPRESWSAPLVHQSGQHLTLRVVSLTSGFTSIVFEDAAVASSHEKPVEILAG